MSIVARHPVEVGGGGSFNVTLVGTGTNRAIYVIAANMSSVSANLSALTLNGVAGTELDSRNATSNRYANLSFYVFTEAQHPGAGSFTFAPTWSSTLNATYMVIEVDDSTQSAPFIHEHNKPAFIEDVETTPLSATLSSSQGKLTIIYAGAVGASFFNSTLSTKSANLANEVVTSVGNETNWLSINDDASVDTNSETYTATYDNGGVGWTTDNVYFGAFSINSPEVNQDPQLDTPHPDVTVQTSQVGSIDFGSNFSDANAGDTLTFAIAPDISLLTGWAFDTNTGIASFDGSQALLAATNYTISASDGNGGTDATDVVSIEVVPPLPTISNITEVRLGESFTVTATNVTDLTTATTVTLSVNGSGIGAPISTTATTATFTMPSVGFQLGVGTFALTVDEGTSQTSPDFNAGILPPTGKEYVTLTTIDEDSWLNDPDYNANAGGAANNIGTSDQVIYDGVTSPGGYTVQISETGLITVLGAGTETQNQTIVWHYLDAQDSFLAGANQTLTLYLGQTLSSPTGTATGQTTATGSVTTTGDDGTLYFYVSTNASETINDIKTNGTSQAVTLTGVQNVGISGLTASTTYYIHFVHTNALSSDSNVATTSAFTTDSVPDSVAPVLSNPVQTVTGTTTATLEVDTDEANGLIYVLIDQISSASLGDIKTNGTSYPIESVGTFSLPATGLTEGTTYYVHYVHTDEAGNDSLVLDTPGFTTLSVTPPTINNIDGDNDVYPGQIAVINGAEFGNTQGTVTLGGVVQTVTNWTDTAITITVVKGSMDYASNHQLVVTLP